MVFGTEVLRAVGSSRDGLKRSFFLLTVWFVLQFVTAIGQILPLPERPANAPSGSEFARQIASVDLSGREAAVVSHVLSGNVPPFLRHLCSVQVTNVVSGRTNTATFFVTPDYLAIGSDTDYFRIPISPNTAQRIADALNCSLPTRKMVDEIYATAPVKLSPAPIPPSPAMTTVGVFVQHNAMVQTQRTDQLPAHPLGTLVSGHKKDVVISAKLATAPGRVAIYGWHKTNGAPIQPLYLGHTAAWVDYSQCTRLVQQQMVVNGSTNTVASVLADPGLAALLSDEGPILSSHYPTNVLSGLSSEKGESSKSGLVESAASGAVGGPVIPELKPSPYFNERSASFDLAPEVKVHINAPAETRFPGGKKVRLIFYALPNGNTTEQTIGKQMKPGEDWHYDIQHVGAQTRFLRELLPERAVVVAYLENSLKSWPAWRKKYGDEQIPKLIDYVKRIFAGHQIETVLSGHSGGGSLLFGYFNAVGAIPEDVVRIAFLDSNYAYDSKSGHKEKLVTWLKASDRHFLCVLAYNDAVALLDGKTFVSAAGGTWGKSREMQRDLAESFEFSSHADLQFERFSALDGRLQFILKENPEKKIFHTVQVERNGFIHSMVSGTTNENRGYEYFGPRAYSKWIQ